MLSCFSCDPTYCSLPGSCDHEILQTRILGVDCCFLLHGIFPTQGSNPQSLTSSVLAGGFFTACTTWEVWTTVSVLVYTSQHLFSTILVVSFQHFFFWAYKLPFTTKMRSSNKCCFLQRTQQFLWSDIKQLFLFCFVLWQEITPRPCYANQQQALTHQRAEVLGQKEAVLTGGGTSTWKFPI